MLDPGDLESLRHAVDHRVGSHHRDRSVGDVVGEAACRGGDILEQTGGCRVHEVGSVVALAYTGGGTQRGGCRQHHLVGEGHDLGGDAVANAETDHPRRLLVGEMSQHVIPVVGRQRTCGLGDVADHRHASVERAP